MKTDPNKTYKQWAASYYDPPGAPTEDEMDVMEREARAEFGPGYQVAHRQVLGTTEQWDEEGNVLPRRVGLVVFVFEKQA